MRGSAVLASLLSAVLAAPPCLRPVCFPLRFAPAPFGSPCRLAPPSVPPSAHSLLARGAVVGLRRVVSAPLLRRLLRRGAVGVRGLAVVAPLLAASVPPSVPPSPRRFAPCGRRPASGGRPFPPCGFARFARPSLRALAFPLFLGALRRSAPRRRAPPFGVRPPRWCRGAFPSLRSGRRGGLASAPSLFPFFGRALPRPGASRCAACGGAVLKGSSGLSVRYTVIKPRRNFEPPTTQPSLFAFSFLPTPTHHPLNHPKEISSRYHILPFQPLSK